ncbi:MAG: hypothetical protein E6K18_02285 [Methanobacteriota archaeon]|nr:MAG: hypothetical protein E6K18_02285 [Euryarchaeota archaeon]
MHLASKLGLRDNEAFQAAYWKAFEDFFGPNNAAVVKAMTMARTMKVDTGEGDIDRVCFGLRQTMSWLAEAIERKALASIGQPVPGQTSTPPKRQRSKAS